MQKLFIGFAYGVIGLAVAIGLTFGAYALAGKDLAQPAEPVGAGGALVPSIEPTMSSPDAGPTDEEREQARQERRRERIHERRAASRAEQRQQERQAALDDHRANSSGSDDSGYDDHGSGSDDSGGDDSGSGSDDSGGDDD